MKTVEYINQFQSRLLRLGSRSEMVLLSNSNSVRLPAIFWVDDFCFKPSTLQHSEELSYTI